MLGRERAVSRRRSYWAPSGEDDGAGYATVRRLRKRARVAACSQFETLVATDCWGTPVLMSFRRLSTLANWLVTSHRPHCSGTIQRFGTGAAVFAARTPDAYRAPVHLSMAIARRRLIGKFGEGLPVKLDRE